MSDVAHPSRLHPSLLYPLRLLPAPARLLYVNLGTACVPHRAHRACRRAAGDYIGAPEQFPEGHHKEFVSSLPDGKCSFYSKDSGEVSG